MCWVVMPVLSPFTLSGSQGDACPFPFLMPVLFLSFPLCFMPVLFLSVLFLFYACPFPFFPFSSCHHQRWAAYRHRSVWESQITHRLRWEGRDRGADGEQVQRNSVVSHMSVTVYLRLSSQSSNLSGRSRGQSPPAPNGEGETKRRRDEETKRRGGEETWRQT